MCSALLALFDASVISGNSTKSVAWSNSCVDQNNNFGLLCFWQYLILTKRFVVIEHKFLEVAVFALMSSINNSAVPARHLRSSNSDRPNEPPARIATGSRFL